MKKNKKIKIIIIIIIFIIILWTIYDFTPLIKVPLANIIYGTSSCSKYNSDKSKSSSKSLFYEDADYPIIGGDQVTKWKCSLCFRGGTSGTTITPELCNKCAKITNKCDECGKLIK